MRMIFLDLLWAYSRVVALAVPHQWIIEKYFMYHVRPNSYPKSVD
jgi:hypothetical protein